MPGAPDVFVSYTQADRAWAEWMAWVLEEAGFSTVLQAWDFAAGENFVARMQQASAETKRTIAVLSPDYARSRWGEWEWTAALAEGRLLPVRVREFDPAGLLKVAIHVDLVGVDEASARARLLAELERDGRAKPAVAPAFPGGELARTTAPRFPGALPEIWNVPPIRNPNFTGRDSELARLQAALASERVVALTGLGGVGKSQLAAQYAHRHAADYELVWWVTADAATVVRDLAALAGRLEPAEAGLADEPAAAEAARRRLERRGGWLLVFDNAGDPATVRPWLPEADTGHVLITSRYAAWGGSARSERVEPLGVEDAARFLERRAGADDPAAARVLADRLGGLPLALEQAGAYLEATGIALAEYVQLFDARRPELLARAPDPGAPTVATTWELAFEQLAKRAPDAADLLIVAAFVAPEEIPRALFADRDALPEPLRALGDALAFNDALAVLGRYSLITLVGDAFSVHRLVQAVTRDRLSDADRCAWTQTALELLAATFPFDADDPATWTVAGRLLPHALRACEHAHDAHTAADAASYLLNQSGVYLRGRAEFADAQTAFERALAIHEAAYGPDHPAVAIDVNNLGLLLQDLGELDAARAAFERALTIHEAAYGPDHPTVAIRVNNLGLLLRDLGELDAARAAFERALTIDEAAYGPDHRNVARDVNNLGLLLQDLGELDAARAAFKRALTIHEAAYGPDHPAVATIVNNLGRVLRDLGELDAARAAHERALTIDEAAYGPDHPTVAIIVNNLGLLLQDLGELDAARAAFERALTIHEAAYGPDHPAVATDVNNLGLVLRAHGELDAARAAFERALTIHETAYGPDHPAVATDVTNLGLVLRARGELDAARAAYERALTIFEAALGTDHPSTRKVRGYLSALSETLS